MKFPIPVATRRFFSTSRFWQDNYLLLREFKHFKKTAILAIAFTLLAAAFEGLGVGLLLSFLQSLTQPDTISLKTGIDWIDIWFLGLNQPQNVRVYRISAVLIVVHLLRGGFVYLGIVYSRYAQADLSYQLRIRTFEQLQKLRLEYFSTTRSGMLVNTITNEINQLKQVFELTSQMLIKASNLIVYVVSMLAISWKLTSVSLMLFTLMTVGISTLLKKVREISFARTVANGEYTSVALEFINGIRTVHSSSAQDYERQRFYRASRQIEEVERRSAIWQSTVEPITITTSVLIIIGILLFSFSLLVSANQLSIAALFTFLFVLFRTAPIVRILNSNITKLNNFQGSIENIKQLLKVEGKPYLQNGNIKFDSLKKSISFRNVCFAYEPNKPILKNIDIEIKRGEVTALVGSSGSGKSTLSDLIPRLYEYSSGSILIDGLELKSLDINSLRKKMAIVNQDTFIFNASVRDNISYGLRDVSESDIWQAAQLSHAIEFIRELPDGLDTVLGDRGVKLSGGQRQRIAIARALLREPDILILDEATSALDSITEQLIQKSLERLSKGRTVIVIAHRLSTIAKADKVVVLEQGKIVEQGNYHDLLHKKAALWKYHQMQFELSSAKV